MAIHYTCDACKEKYDPKVEREIRVAVPVNGFTGLYIRGIITIDFTPSEKEKDVCSKCVMKSTLKALEEVLRYD